MEDAAYVANGPDRCARCKTALMDGAGPVGRRRGCHRGARGERQRPGRPPPRAGRRRPRPAPPSRWSRPASPRTTSATGPACSGCAPGTSRPPPAWPRACPTAPRSPWAAWPPSRRPRRRCTRSASGSCGCATTATPPGWRWSPTSLAEVVARRDEVVAAVRAAGFRFVALDLEGFRSGSLNRGLREAGASEGEP